MGKSATTEENFLSTISDKFRQLSFAHINRSGLDFTPVDGKVLFGCSVVRNVGHNAIA